MSRHSIGRKRRLRRFGIRSRKELLRLEDLRNHHKEEHVVRLAILSVLLLDISKFV